MITSLSYLYKSLRASAVLTGTYVAADVLGQQGVGTMSDVVSNNQLVLYVAFTLGNLTSAQIKVEFSDDGVTYYQESSESVSAGVSTVSLEARTLSATGNYRIPVSIADRYIRVSAKGTGDTTNSLMAIAATLSVR